MYLGYWRLGGRPFDERIDVSRFFASTGHQDLVCKLRFGIDNSARLVVLAGPAGSGKSAVAAKLLAELPPEQHATVALTRSPLNAAAALAAILDECSGSTEHPAPPQDATPDRVVELAERLELASAEVRSSGRLVVVFDHVRYMPDLELHLLLDVLSTSIGSDAARLTAIVVLSPEAAVRAERTHALRSRPVLKCNLAAMPPADTARYIAHQLRWAGGTPTIFTPEAVDLIHDYSGGLPRAINRLCDLSLLVGFAEERERVDAVQVETAWSEQQLFRTTRRVDPRDRRHRRLLESPIRPAKSDAA